MPPTLPDDADEWTDRLQATVNDDDEFAAAAAGFDATFRFLILPDESYQDDPVALTIVVDDGACVAAAGHDSTATYDFTLSGPYEAWKDLLQDEVDVKSAVMSGRFDLEGSTTELLQRREAVTALVRAAQSIETDFAV